MFGVDINECEEVMNLCDEGEMCINNDGSFQCEPGCGSLQTWNNYTCVGKEDKIVEWLL